MLKLRRSAARTIVLAALAATVAAGCAIQTEGTAVSPLYDPYRVGGLPAVDGPSGIRPDAPRPVGKVFNTDKGDIDTLALSAVNDIEEFWSQHYREPFAGTFRRVNRLISYDAEDRDSPRICGASPYGQPNAFFCPRDRSIAWDRGVLLPIGVKYFGPMSVVGLVAHEYGHALQYMAELVDQDTAPIVREQQADCFAGVYIRHVAEGNSRRFQIDTADGLSHVLASLIAIRDPLLGPDDEKMLEFGHGTAVDRVTAFQTGFVRGLDACVAIDLRDVEERRGELPMSLQEGRDGALETGEAPVNERTLAVLFEGLDQIYAPTAAPELVFASSPDDHDCPDARATAPASYCPATNTVTVDVEALRALGQPGDERTNAVLLQGDNTALSIVVSRYLLAVQHERGLPLRSAATALRTACLTGMAQRHLSEPVELPSGEQLWLTAGDIDEAAAGLLTNGQAATDVDGATVPAGFTRIVAFRSGLVDHADGETCYARFG
ncbi:lipoprotein peptidase LpqM [Mycolicibacterium chitae]|uniref:Lipoprotein peptidase LpqM n=1 Tax=Mycolicibacterium chitae TaxID=1792 RepID=A0A448I8X6_MYCCI|nr:neutral zinc metallopeptidase [Mycolicibacterium chitae]MCV7105417.1 neutral zinc metallopeptidase [Mycolicibacterium chitae]BBZ05231.1 lipoprotein peptidase LpqM [Mycolicibacterium chitae]VEG48850.1 lipoprotein peptidase LpqM [Mycolicibacterium chitae]